MKPQKPDNADIFGHFSVPSCFVEMLAVAGDDVLKRWERRLRFQALCWPNDPYYAERLGEVLSELSRRGAEHPVVEPGETLESGPNAPRQIGD